MGLFNNPGPSVTPDELNKILSFMRNTYHIPHDVLDDWRAASVGFMQDRGKYRGMDASEISAYIGSLRTLTDRKQYLQYLDELEVELKKAVKGRYGNPIF